MNVLICYDSKNSFLRNDGDEFKRQAKNCSRYYWNSCDSITYEFDVSGTDKWAQYPRAKNAFEKRQNLFRHIESMQKNRVKFDRIIFFMHGGKRNLNRKMIAQKPHNIDNFAERIKSVASPNCKIVLFSCWTGRIEDGFAAEFSRLTGCDVVAHTTRGHTTRNPYKIIYNGEYKTKGQLRNELWRIHGGIRALKKRLESSNVATFEFVEEIFND